LGPGPPHPVPLFLEPWLLTGLLQVLRGGMLLSAGAAALEPLEDRQENPQEE
ncbi:hypothetical protein P7K49_005702, partial [Saguinus oedipus]